MSGQSVSKRAKKLDLFCWKCHKSETNIGCIGCERSFHSKCISVAKDFKDFASNWMCNECTNSRRNSDPSCPLDGIKLQQLMLLSLKMISKSADYYYNSDNCFADKKVAINTSLIINPISLKKIEDKINNFQYKSFGQMTADFKWILHNAIIGQLESGLLQNAKFLLSKAKSEQKDFEECVFCFINYYKTSKAQYYSWFSRPCPQMHVIVWAKVKGHPFWPSKVIRPNQQNDSILVRFFGTHQKSWVKEKDCYLISEKTPQQLKGKALGMVKLWKAAIEELNYHIKYLKDEHPNWFRYYPSKTPFLMKDSSIPSIPESNQQNIRAIKVEENYSKPKAKKTFPNALNGISNETKDITNNPFEITHISSDTVKRSVKSIPKIEILEFNSQQTQCKTETNEIPDNKLKAKNLIISERKKHLKTKKIAINTDICIKSSIDRKPNVKDVNECQKKRNANGVVDKYVRLKSDNDIKDDNSLEMSKLVQKLRQKVYYMEKKAQTKESLHKKEIMEMQQKFDSEMEAMKRSLEEDKQRAIVDARNKQIAINSDNLYDAKKKFETTKIEMKDKHNLEIKSLEQKWIQQMKECKRKMWCFNCLEEAQLYCCSHTYYCTTDCQQRHWDSHKKVCVQRNNLNMIDS